MSFSGELVLHGQRLTAREFRPDDLDDVHGIVGDDRVTRSLSFDSRTREETCAMLSGAIARAAQAPRTEFYLAVVSHTHGDVVGFVRLALGGVRAAKLGFAVGTAHWRQGYATEVAHLMLGFGFDRLDLHRVTAAVGPSNAASTATVRRLGFVQEGCLRDHVYTNGGWRDSVLFSLLAGEYANNRASC